MGLVTTNNVVLSTNYTYEPFGNTTASGTATWNADQFTGRKNDSDGLYYYRARYFSLKLQRFISQDPMDFLGEDTNLHSYVRNDPANRVDPIGLATLQVGVAGSIFSACPFPWV